MEVRALMIYAIVCKRTLSLISSAFRSRTSLFQSFFILILNLIITVCILYYVQCMGISWFAKQEAIIVNIIHCIMEKPSTTNAGGYQGKQGESGGRWRFEKETARERNYT